MKRLKVNAAWIAAMGVGLSAPVMAHHSAAMFDHAKRMTVEGTVKEWQWTNPHAWLQVLVTDDKGVTVEQGFELGSPNTLARNGFRRDTFKSGDHVTVVGSPRKDGKPGGALLEVKTAGGRWMQWGAGADAQAAAAAGVPTT